MAKIHNLKELNELGRNLRHDDRIYFTTKVEPPLPQGKRIPNSARLLK